MNTITSKGVEVTVEVFYQSEYSKPLSNEHMFAYRITIVNLNCLQHTITTPSLVHIR